MGPCVRRDDGCGIPVQTTNMTSRSRGVIRPSFARKLLTLQSEGAGKAGCALHPRSRVQNAREKTHTSIQVQRKHPTFPAQWFTAYSVLSPAIRICLSPSSALAGANLTPTLRRQDHTSSPSAPVALVSRNCRVHRIPPRVRDDRDPPLSSGETGGNID